MNFFTAMGMGGNKYIKTVVVLTLSLLFFGCPNEDCDEKLKVATIPDLITIEPIQEVYTIGDEIFLTIIVPSYIESFGNAGDTIDIFQETNDLESFFGAPPIHHFAEDDIEVIEGRTEIQNETLVGYLEYNAEAQEYRFIARIIFTQAMNYTVFGKITGLGFGGKGYPVCPKYLIDTNIEGMNEQGTIEFVVE